MHYGFGSSQYWIDSDGCKNVRLIIESLFKYQTIKPTLLNRVGFIVCVNR